jgi:hypothetical protein
MKDEIKKRLNCLVGLPLFKMGRSGNLIWMSFGNGFKFTDKNGKEKLIGEYALNIQCCWRMTKNNRIIVAYRDIYYPSKLWTGNEDLFNWDVQGMNRCDELIKEIIPNNKTNETIYVKSIEADDIGGFKIVFTGDYLVDVFPDNSIETEFWRFFSKLDSEKHFVVSTRGID